MNPEPRKSRILLAVLLPILLSVGLATRMAHAQAVRYVDANGQGVVGAGCMFQPCAGDPFVCGYDTIQCALNAAGAGDVILVNQGFYPGGSSAPVAATNLTIKAIGHAVIDCQGVASIGLFVRPGTLVEGFRVVNCPAIGLQATDQNNVSVVNCQFQNNGMATDFWGSSASSARQSLYAGNNVAIRIAGSTGNAITRNTFHSNGTAVASAFVVTGTSILGNIFSNNGTAVAVSNAVGATMDLNNFFGNTVSDLQTDGTVNFGPNDRCANGCASRPVNPSYVDALNGVYLLQPMVGGNLNSLLNAGPRIMGQTTNIGAYGAGVGIGSNGLNRFAAGCPPDCWITSPDRADWTNVSTTSTPVHINGNGNLQLNLGLQNGWVRSPVYNLSLPNLIGDGLRSKTVRAVNVTALEDNLLGTAPGAFNVIDIDADPTHFTLTGQNPLADNPLIATRVLTSPTRSREQHIRVSDGGPDGTVCFEATASDPPFRPVLNGTKFTLDSGNPNARSVACVQMEFLLSQTGP